MKLFSARSAIVALAACSLIVISIATAAFSASADNALIDRIRQHSDKIRSFSSGFEQALSHKESGSTEKRKGRILFQKPMLIRWQTAKPHEETLVINEKEIWDYLPDEEVAYRYSPDLVKDSRGIIQVLTGQAALTKDFDVKPSGNEGPYTKLTLYPHEPTTQMVEAAIWVDPQTGAVHRAKITDFYGNTNDVRLTDFQADTKTAKKDFQFVPPKGIEIEDRMEQGSGNRELFK